MRQCFSKIKLRSACLTIVALPFALISETVSSSDYGTTGLIDVPSARMQGDGTLTASAAWDGLHKSYTFSYQVTPWLEGTFRYTGFNDFFYWDRNYEFKARLWEEQFLLPQVSVGIRDLVGTGVFGSEYVVASKSFQNWDYTLGFGWGRLAGNGIAPNPLRLLAEQFKDRPVATPDVTNAGKVRPNFYFRGEEIGLFGGVEYRLQRMPLSLIAEYNPDQYEFNAQRGAAYEPSSAVSVGLKWEVRPGLSLMASYQHGDQFGFSFSAAVDTKSNPARRPPPNFISSLDLRQDQLPVQIDKRRWYDRLLYDVERSGLVLVAGRLSEDQTQAELVIGNSRYPVWADAVARHVALADLHLPPSVRVLYLTLEDGGHRVSKLMIPRPSAMQATDKALAAQRIRVLPSSPILGDVNKTDFTTGLVNITANINNRLQLFDPDDPARYQFYLDLGAEYALSNHWALRAKYAIDLTNNFGESRRKRSDSKLPKVRSDIVRYLTEGETGLDVLMIEGRGSLAPDLHYRAFGGVLEEMYSGLGGELLYWPHQSRIAAGISLSYVKQRGFDKDFSHLDYTVATGFASIYWATPFYNFDAAAHVGRYLAKDLGATIEIRRTFANGWQVGAWATLTDVPSEVFGEGSFDKGFFFKIPFDSLLGNDTRSAYSTRIRPVQRDGGQRLENHSANIFWDLREARYDVLLEAEARLLP